MAVAAGDLLINFKHYEGVLKNTMLVAPSRSGGTSEVILAAEKVRALGVPIIGIAAKRKAPLADLADLSIELPWAFDESVCQTRTVTNLYTANLLLLGMMGKDKQLVEEIDRAIANGRAFMEEYTDLAREIAGQEWDNVVILADSELAGIAREAAIAFIEIPQVHANHYHVLDVRHGPMVLVNAKTLVVAVMSPEEVQLQQELLADLKGRGAKVVTISQDASPWDADWNVVTPRYRNFAVMGIPFIFIPQAVGFFKAVAKGLNPDVPPGLEPMISLG